MAVVEVPQTLEYRGGQLNAAPVLEVENFTNWKKRFMCHILEEQWTVDERKAANLDQRLKSLIMSVFLDDQINSIINCLTTKSTWDDLILYHEAPSDVKESRVMDLKLCYNTFKFKEGETLTQTFTRYKALMNELVNDGITLSKLEINIGFINGLPKKWLSFCQSLKNTNHVKNSELDSLFGKLKYEENLIDSIYETKKNKSLVSATPLFQSSTVKNKGLIAEAYEWDEKEVSSDEIELVEEKLHHSFEMEDNDDRKTYLDYLCIDLNYVEEQRNNLLSKHRDLVHELNACKEQLLVLKQAKLDFLTMQHVNTEILKENKNLRTKLKELTAITETWLNSSNKVNQCISEQIPSQKKRILGVDQLTEDPSSSGQKDLVFVKSSADDTKVSIPGVERPWLSEAEGFILPNHDTGRILPAESQRNTTDPSVAVTDSSATDYDSADESSVCSTPLPPLKKLDGAEPTSGPKTVKSILRSKSTFKAETLKASKVNSAPAGKLKSVKIEDDPPLAICEKTDHRTCDHAEYISTMNMSQHLKSLGRSSSRSKIPRPSKRFFPPCTHCGVSSRHMTGVKNYLHKYMEQPGPKVVLDLTSITETWLKSSNKVNQYISEQIPTQNRKILGIDQLTKDTLSSRPKDLVFVKSSADNSNVSITSSNKPRLCEAANSTLPNHDTAKVPSDESQRNTTDPSFAVSDSSSTNYDSTDESSVCSTPLPPLEKLVGAKHVFGPKTIKSVLKSNSTFKAETLKAPVGKLKNVKIEDDPPLATVMKELNELKLQLSKNKFCFAKKCKRTNHRTCDHAEFMSFIKTTQHLTGQGESSSRSMPSRQEGEALKAKKARANKTVSSNVQRSKTPTKRLLAQIWEVPGPKVMYRDDSTYTIEGHGYHEGINYDKTYGPIAKLKAIKIFLAFATYMNFIIYQMDVKSAFLNGKLKEEVYVKQPPGFESSKIDNNLFVYKTQTDVILVQIYVDDIILGSTSTKLCKQLAKLMTQRYEISMMGVLAYILGFQIKQSQRGISINQEKCVKDLLKKYDINGSSVKTPMVPANKLGPDLNGKVVNKTQYRGMIGSLMYLTESRHDIQFSTCLCARYQANPKESYLIAVKRIFRKSTSAKAEYAAARCCANILWMNSQLTDYDIIYEKVPIYYDNTSAIAISNIPVLHSRTKHIDIRYYFI
ncbi:retrovirus-related pol polyprotein from transposon TNT 1-94 [Tanacetum coccineum]